jgi:hypothetical protein
MTQLTFFGPEATPFILSLAYHLTCLDHRVLVLSVGPDHARVPIHAAHLAGIRLGELHVQPQHFAQAAEAVTTAGFGHALVVWSGPAQPLSPPVTRVRLKTAHLTLQELALSLAQRIEQSRLAGMGSLALTVTDVPNIH